ncbi:MAG: hypothetical protein SFV54_23135 [Bryobacteraceae bacterium]|nr:hypothetical protein [Bryobacteraceae bacterium]
MTNQSALPRTPSPSRAPWTKHIPTALIMLTFAVGGYFAGAALGRLLKGGAYGVISPWTLALIPGAAFAALALHEFGHVLGGWASGFRLYLFAAGPVRLQRIGGRLKLSFNSSLALWGGIAASLPVRPDLDVPQMRAALTRIVAGGPALSALGALALLIPANIAVTTFGLTSLLVAIATLIPNRMGGYASDGCRLRQLLTNHPESGRWMALALLAGYSESVRPAEWPAPLVAQASEPHTATNDGISGAWMRASSHLDRNEIDLAESWLAFALDNECAWPAVMRPLLHADAVFLHALHRDDSAAARRHLPRLKTRGLLPAYVPALAEAAVLAAEGQRSAAAAQLERARLPKDAALSSQLARELAEKIRRRIAA